MRCDWCGKQLGVGWHKISYGSHPQVKLLLGIEHEEKNLCSYHCIIQWGKRHAYRQAAGERDVEYQG